MVFTVTVLTDKGVKNIIKGLKTNFKYKKKKVFKVPSDKPEITKQGSFYKHENNDEFILSPATKQANTKHQYLNNVTNNSDHQYEREY